MNTERDDKHTGNTFTDPKHPDPITGEPGSHPVGTGIGTASGAATGAAIGALGGPIGMAIGAIAGGVTGAAVGHGVGEAVDPTEEDAYWRNNYRDRDYVQDNEPYETYGDAYTYGTHAGMRRDEPFEQNEGELATAYRKHVEQVGEGTHTRTEWSKARGAVKDAYNRVRTKRGL